MSLVPLTLPTELRDALRDHVLEVTSVAAAGRALRTGHAPPLSCRDGIRLCEDLGEEEPDSGLVELTLPRDELHPMIISVGEQLRERLKAAPERTDLAAQACIHLLKVLDAEA